VNTALLRFFLLFLLLSSACSVKNVIVTPETGSKLIAPYEVNVKEDLYDGETLFLQLELLKLDPLNNNFALLRLTGFNQEQVKVEKYYNLIDFKPDAIQELTLALPLKGLVDYQLQLYWGKQAVDFYRIIYPTLSEKLIIVNGQVEKIRECKKAICQIKFKIKFMLVNNNEMTLPDINIVLSLLEKMGPLDSDQVVEIYAKTIPVKDFNIRSGEQRELEYTVTQPEELNNLHTVAEVRISDIL
jgi:hypothetical protein